MSPIATLRRAPRLPLTDDAVDARRRRGIGMALVLAVQLMLILDGTVVNVALPRIASDLSFGPASLSWVLNVYALAFGGLLVLGGRLGDVLGRRSTLQLGLVVFTIGSALGGLAPSAGLLLAARAMQGVGAALAAPSTLALLTTNAPDEPARLRALALFGAVSSSGASIGLILGGLLTDIGSWRWTLFINVPIGLAVVLLAPRFVVETDRRSHHFDVLGALLATGGAVSLVWGLIGAPSHGWDSARTLGSLAAGLVLLATLVVVERRVTAPLLPPALLTDRNRVGALAAMGLLVGGQLSSFYLLVQFLVGVLGLGPMEAGLAFLPLTLGIFTASRLSPRLVTRFGAPAVLTVGTLMGLVSFLWMAQVEADSTYAGALLVPFILNGFGAGLSFMPITSIVMARVAPEHAGSASGLLQTMQQLGAAIGSAVIVSVFASHVAGTDIAAGLPAAFMTASGFAAASVLAGVALVVARRRHERVAAVEEPVEVLEAA